MNGPDIKKGEQLTKEKAKITLLGFGLASKYLDKFLSSKAMCDIGHGTPISLNVFQKKIFIGVKK